jgi:hypothetical protein
MEPQPSYEKKPASFVLCSSGNGKKWKKGKSCENSKSSKSGKNKMGAYMHQYMKDLKKKMHHDSDAKETPSRDSDSKESTKNEKRQKRSKMEHDNMKEYNKKRLDKMVEAMAMTKTNRGIKQWWRSDIVHKQDERTYNHQKEATRRRRLF